MVDADIRAVKLGCGFLVFPYLSSWQHYDGHSRDSIFHPDINGHRRHIHIYFLCVRCNRACYATKGLCLNKKYGKFIMNTITTAWIKNQPRIREAFKFGIVGGSGTVVNLGALYALTNLGSFPYWVSFGLSSVLAMTNNYVFNSLWTFRGFQGVHGFGRYVLVSLATIALYEIILIGLTNSGLWYMAAAAITILLGFLLNLTLSKKFVWRQRG